MATSSGKVPDVASLVREARADYAMLWGPEVVNHDLFELTATVAQYVPKLCDALEEREREVEQLRGALQTMIYRTEQIRENLNKRSVVMPLWCEIVWSTALELGREVAAARRSQREERDV